MITHTKQFGIKLFFSLLLLCVIGPLSLPINLHLSFTLQTLFVLLPACLFGINIGVSTLIIYLTMGALGVPVFANYTSGFSGPTIGYLLAFLPAVWLIAKAPKQKNWWLFVWWLFAHCIIICIGLTVQANFINLKSNSVLAIAQKLFVGAIIKSIAGVLLINLYTRINCFRTQQI